MITYEDRGVSAGKADVKAAIKAVDPGLFPGAFCKAVPDVLGGSPDHCLLLHADGAGTKAAVAYMHYRRHKDASIFYGIAQDSLVMNLDDLACVGASGPFALSNTIGRNAKLVPGEVIEAIVTGYEMLAQKLKGYGIDIHGCGGETADVGDLVRTIIVDSTMAVRMARADFVDCSRVACGHDIVGLASSGRAVYEETYNSGVGSNGFTAMRHEVLAGKYREEFPETYAPEIAGIAYTGKWDIDDALPGTPMTVCEALPFPDAHVRAGPPGDNRPLQECDLGRLPQHGRGADEMPVFRGKHQIRERQSLPGAAGFRVCQGADGFVRERNVQGIQHGAPHRDSMRAGR